MPKWTVTGPDGLDYRGIDAPTREEAIERVRKSTMMRPAGPLTGPPSPFLQNLGTLPSRAKRQIEDVPKSAKQKLLDAGWSEADAEQKAQEIGVKLAQAPASWWDLAGLAVPLVAGALVPAGRTVSRALGTFGTNILGGGLLGAAQEAVSPTGAGMPAAGLVGALKAAPSAAAQTAVSAIIGPGRSTLQTQKAIRHLQNSLSEPVAELLDPQRPSTLFSRQTVTAMTDKANQALDAMEARVAAGLRRQMFTVPVPIGKGETLKAPLPFEEIRAQVKALRDIGDAQYGTPEMRETARKAIQGAEQLEESMLEQMRAKGFSEIADDYAETLARYKMDRTAIRTVKAMQRSVALPGGANPEDFRELSKMVDDLRTPDLRAAARSIVAAIFAAKGHPGIAAHYGPFGAGKTIRPSRVSEYVGPLRQPGSAVLGSAAGLGVRYGQLPPLTPVAREPKEDQ